MIYRKINIELIVIEEESEAVVEQLNAALDRLEDGHTIFGGEIETCAIEEPGTPRRSALTHTLAAGETAASAVKAAGEKVVNALRKVL
ncbi:hypothetical protein [Tunturibacter empetritectus]|uniref:Uncharacterized protein n=1 Tax=Tunturiibacter lichenicola TaxID=2051959 RepID=A0A7W8N5K6_9BACT|nr:hypothetical protein [Edaphobacter lichenicola]MBB5344656.1 hypothetical protein [Edaphobacter lichenicola]